MLLFGDPVQCAPVTSLTALTTPPPPANPLVAERAFRDPGISNGRARHSPQRTQPY